MEAFKSKGSGKGTHMPVASATLFTEEEPKGCNPLIQSLSDSSHLQSP